MSSAEQSMPRPDNASTRMILVLSAIAMMSGFLVVLVSQVTAPMIAENQRLAIEKALVKIIPGSVVYKKYILHDGVVSLPESVSDGEPFYAGYDADDKLLGVASNASAQGYADMIYLLYSYEPECECIRGFQVLKMAETPGLGDKIIKDKNFQKNFDALDASLDVEGKALKNSIVTVKHGSKEHDWQIDAISGATVSSKAVGKAINKSAQVLLPQLVPLVPQLQNPELIK